MTENTDFYDKRSCDNVLMYQKTLEDAFIYTLKLLSIKNRIKGLKRAPNWFNEELIINLIELQKLGMENLAPKKPRTVIPTYYAGVGMKKCGI